MTGWFSHRLIVRFLAAACVAVLAALTLGGAHAQAPFGGITKQAPAPAPGRIGWLAGDYRVDGRNSNGSRYRGRVNISVDQNVAYFRWTIGRDVYRGKGTLSGNVLTIYWGQPDPVIYIVNSDGTLAGTWDRGRASERLTPLN